MSGQHRSVAWIGIGSGIASLLVAGALTAPAGAARACSVTITDAANDVVTELVANGQAAPAVPNREPNLDLLKVTLARQAGATVVTFTVGGLTLVEPEPTEGSPFLGLQPLGSWRLRFTSGSHRYLAATTASGFRLERDGHALPHVTGAIDTATNTITLTAMGVDVGGALTAVSADSIERVINAPDTTLTSRDVTSTLARVTLAKCSARH